MKRFKHTIKGARTSPSQMKTAKRAKKESSERVGFYVALSVCMFAVGLAVWSAYTSFDTQPDESDSGYFASLSSTTAPVAEQMTGVTEAERAESVTSSAESTAQPETKAKSIIISESPTEKREEDAEREEEMTSLQAVLKVTDSLVYPVKSRSVIKQYSEEAVYSQTMRDYRPHTGCDFAAEQGENVYAMCNGTVKGISVSELYGVIAEVESEGFSVYYCGLDPQLNVEKGYELNAGDTIGTVAQVPCESEDESHIHIEIRVGNKLIDPLSVINSNS